MIILQLETTETYLTLDGEEVEYNDAIPPKYVVRDDIQGEDLEVFEDLQQAKSFATSQLAFEMAKEQGLTPTDYMFMYNDDDYNYFKNIADRHYEKFERTEEEKKFEKLYKKY